MGIYIKGMKMPNDENGFVKLIIFNDGRCFVAVGENEVTSKTGIVTARELPPHGRMIDADANIKALNACIEKPEDDIARECYKYAKALLNACPTIIPADPEGGADG